MNDELVRSIIALMRADILPFLHTDGILYPGLNAAVGGRFYPSSQVPPNAPFPRNYIELRRPARYTRWNRSDGAIDREQPVAILWATNTATSATAFYDIQRWDRRARSLLEYNVRAAGLVYFMRVGDVESSMQSDDLNTYVMGGGLYTAYFQE
jgi:hypothetical protein